MREIKFRAWDESNKIMHFDVEFIRSGTEGNDWIIFKSDKQTLNDKNVLDNPYFQQQIKLMQYTGLKDKNGVEIYEGDILKKSVSEYDLVKVYFANGMFMCESASESRITGTTHWKQIHSLFYDEYYKYNNYKVIGNIYENPELLGVQ